MYEGSKEECSKYEIQKRRTYGENRHMVDCFICTESAYLNRLTLDMYLSSLSKEERQELIIVDGKTYNKAIYDFHQRKKNNL